MSDTLEELSATLRQYLGMYINLEADVKASLGHATWNPAESERYHRTLFRDLRHLLVENSCWPYRDEGTETETPS